MKTQRSTVLAERLIIWTAIIVLTWFTGYEWGSYSTRVELQAACKEPRKMQLQMNKTQQKRFINYWKART